MAKEEQKEWMVGLLVKIKTTLGDEIEGEIFSFDSNTNSVVLFDILFITMQRIHCFR
jgi:small nuclear ribonucleoprotein (snRNP)-like protein